MKATSFAASVLVMMSGVLGCASKHPPSQLVDARMTYQQATSVPGASMAASSLYEARQALDAAEQAYAEEGAQSNRTKNLAYIAHRKALVAIARAETIAAQEEQRVALAELERVRLRQAIEMRRQLERAKGLLSRARQEAEAQRRARVAAEAKVQETLEQIEGVKAAESSRGLVMTLSSGAVFSGKSQLTAEAKKQLSEIASVVKDDPRVLMVRVHTDSQGNKDANKTLSLARANAVRAYLLAQGIEEKRVRAEGMGETEPIADNKTPEGRANNRRVEIVLEKQPEQNQPTLPNSTSPRTNPEGPNSKHPRK